MYNKLCIWATLILIYCGSSECQHTDSDSGGIRPNGLESKFATTLFQIGKRTNNPLIKLLGKSFLTLENKFENVEKLVKDANIEKQLAESSRIERRLELAINETEQRLEHMLTNKFDTLTKEMCQMYTCSKWSEWTPCDAERSGEYGLKNRTRECGKHATICTETPDSEEESENVICQLVCPPDYNVTLSEYCVKLYKSTKKSRDDAEKHCQTDGGHLINIDSYSKSEDVTDILVHERPDRVWIGGIQRSSGGKWEFSYGSKNSDFKNWKHDQPNESTFPNCMYLLPSEWYWADFPCKNVYSFMCEIVSG